MTVARATFDATTNGTNTTNTVRSARGCTDAGMYYGEEGRVRLDGDAHRLL